MLVTLRPGKLRCWKVVLSTQKYMLCIYQQSHID